jgi:stage V sporulation protein G
MPGLAEIKVVRLHRLEGDSKTRAFVDVAIGDFVVKGLRLIDGANGLFLSMPREKGKDGKYYDAFFALNQEAKDRLEQTVLGAYQE